MQHWLGVETWDLLTWNTEAPVAVAHAAAHPVGAGVQGAEVDQLTTCGAREARCAATAKPQGAGALGVAGAIVMAGTGGTRVHLLLTGGALITWQ